jgi:hypothetical protein
MSIAVEGPVRFFCIFFPSGGRRMGARKATSLISRANFRLHGFFIALCKDIPWSHGRPAPLRHQNSRAYEASLFSAPDIA